MTHYNVSRSTNFCIHRRGRPQRNGAVGKSPSLRRTRAHEPVRDRHFRRRAPVGQAIGALFGDNTIGPVVGWVAKRRGQGGDGVHRRNRVVVQPGSRARAVPRTRQRCVSEPSALIPRVAKVWRHRDGGFR